MLNVLNIPYTHSGVLASATAMDKISSRLIFASVGIAVPTLLQLEQDSHVSADYAGAHVIKRAMMAPASGYDRRETVSAPERSLSPPQPI